MYTYIYIYGYSETMDYQKYAGFMVYPSFCLSSPQSQLDYDYTTLPNPTCPTWWSWYVVGTDGLQPCCILFAAINIG